MDVSRRNLIAAAGLATVAAKLRADTPALPDKNEFPVVKAEVCLNNARWHPIGVGATRAVARNTWTTKPAAAERSRITPAGCRIVRRLNSPP